jgi:hypothetical protein
MARITEKFSKSSMKCMVEVSTLYGNMYNSIILQGRVGNTSAHADYKFLIF